VPQLKTNSNERYPFLAFYCFSAFLLILGIIILAEPGIFLAFGSSSPVAQYNSGFKHGCDDAVIPELLDRYINQPKTGPSDQTIDFMRGYDDGFNACLNRGSLGSGQHTLNP